MKRSLVALALAFAAGPLFAGASFNGVCYSSTALAGQALAVQMSASFNTGYEAPTATLHVRWFSQPLCSVSSSNATSATVACGLLTVGSTSTSAAGAPTNFNQLLTSGGGFVATFPSCSESSSLTASDGISLGWQAGGVLIAVAGLLSLGRRIFT